MELDTYIAFVAATAVMIAMPGPSVLLTVAHGISLGWRKATLTVLGATAGIAVQLAAAVAGMSVLIRLAAGAFAVLRWTGGLYLIYVALRVWMSARGGADRTAGEVKTTGLFLQGLSVTLPNPKSLIFIAAFVPQFVDGGRPLVPQYALLVPTFLAITFSVTFCWAVLSALMAPKLRQGGSFALILRVASALIALSAIGMILSQGPAGA
jgi:threonine/homoserine/homoserine lactone efflux protein